MRGQRGWGVVALLLLAGCSTSPGSDAPASPTTAVATPAPEPAATTPVIAGPCCLGFELEPGRVASPSWFPIPFTIEIGEALFGWENLNEEGLVIGRGENDVSHLNEYVSFFAVAANSPILRRLGASADLSAAAIEPIELAGVEGLSLDAKAKPSDGRDHPEIQPGSIRIEPIDDLVPGFWYSESAEARFRFVLLPVGGAALFVSIEAPPDRADAFVDEATAMLETIAFD